MKRIIAVIMALCVLACGVCAAEIEGVTASLYEAGLNLMLLRTSETNRASALADYVDTSDGLIRFVGTLTEVTDSLEALLPDQPNVNDQKFINALISIQARINRALVYDLLNEWDDVRSSADERADANTRWTRLRSLADSLNRATTPADLDAIIIGEAIPEPSAPSTYSLIAKGAKGEDVKALQQRLKDLGYLTGTVDGDYGSKTAEAVMLYEQTAGLSVDGVADEIMQASLFSDNAPRKGANGDFLYDILSLGKKGTPVRQMQTRLKTLGYLSGTADGSFGSQTEAAVKQFQLACGLEVTGIADTNTLIRLFAEDAPKFNTDQGAV